MPDRRDPEATISVLIVDDHPVVRNGLRGMFDASAGFTVVGEAGNGPDGVRAAAELEPDVVLMDLRMPGGDGVAAIKEITERRLRSRVLVLTTYDTDVDTIPAIEAGATGYLLKDAARDDLFAGIRAAAAGETVLSPAVARRLVRRVRAPGEALSDREQLVLELVAKGTSNRDIAATLFVSEATVKSHLTHVFEKLGVRDRASAVAAGYERGLLGRR